MRAQWPLLAVLLLGILAITAVWFAVARPFGSDEEEGGGRYVEAIVGTSLHINPVLASLNDADRDLSALIFSGLARLGPTGEILPDLAKSWDISIDGRTYTFHLRPGVSWQTGVPFTADDVIFTYSLLGDPAFPGDPSLSQFWQQVKCQKLDDLTVECEIPEPFAPFLSLATIGILPQHALEGITADKLLDAPFNRAPVGTGPFRLIEIDETKAVLRQNPSYYLGSAGLEEIELRFYPDPHAAMTALFQNEVMGLLVGPNVSQEDLASLTSLDNVRIYTANRTAYTALYFNDQWPLLSDRRVRQAIAYAIDRDAIISGLLSGRAVRADSPIAPGTWASNPDIETYQPDQDRARRLLEEAGWKAEEDEGIRQKEGVELRLSLLTDADSLRQAIAEEIARQLKEVGFEVTVVSLGATDLVRDYLLPQQYQAAVFGFDPGYDPDPYPAWHSSQIDEEGRNLAGYVSEEADKLLEEGRQTIDLDRRQALYYRFQEVFSGDIPALLLYYPVYNYIVDESVRDVQVGTLFDLSSRFSSIHSWTVEEEVLME